MTGLVFDLGGTHLRCAVVTGDGTLTNTTKARIATVSDGARATDVWDDIRVRLAGYVREHVDRTAPGSPIVISFPGPIDQKGNILQAPTLTGGDVNIPQLRAELEEVSGRPVHLLNDLSAAAWYLSRVTPGRFLVVTVSSGIGSKLFDPAIGVLDDLPFAGEIGHSMADFSPDAVTCDCGGRGHLGAIASGRGIERHARAAAQSTPRRFAESDCVRRYHATAQTLSNEEHLVPAFRDGDPWAVEVVTQCSRYLARCLVGSIIVAGLRSVVIIGGFALAAGDAYLTLLRGAARECCDYQLLREGIDQRLVLGAAEDEACLLGAAVFAAKAARP